MVRMTSRETLDPSSIMQLDPSTLLRIKGSCRPMKGIAINSSLCKYPVVRKCATTSGWEEADEKSENWQIFWTDLSVSHQRVKALQPLQRLNHFPDMTRLCHKAEGASILKGMLRYFYAEYHFFPNSWQLPKETAQLHAHLAGQAGATALIFKPNKGCQGADISIVTSADQLEEARLALGSTTSAVVQEYIDRPLLLGGHKFDLRLYVLVTSCTPLRIHLYRDGIARLCTEKYKPASACGGGAACGGGGPESDWRFCHLTNYAINKKHPDFHGGSKPKGGSGAGTDGDDGGGGGDGGGGDGRAAARLVVDGRRLLVGSLQEAVGRGARRARLPGARHGAALGRGPTAGLQDLDRDPADAGAFVRLVPSGRGRAPFLVLRAARLGLAGRRRHAAVAARVQSLAVAGVRDRPRRGAQDRAPRGHDAHVLQLGRGGEPPPPRGQARRRRRRHPQDGARERGQRGRRAPAPRLWRRGRLARGGRPERPQARCDESGARRRSVSAEMHAVHSIGRGGLSAATRSAAAAAAAAAPTSRATRTCTTGGATLARSTASSAGCASSTRPRASRASRWSTPRPTRSCKSSTSCCRRRRSERTRRSRSRTARRASSRRSCLAIATAGRPCSSSRGRENASTSSGAARRRATS